MTTAIVGRVWIEWPADPALPWDWRIYSETTGKLMDDVVAMQITVEVHSLTVVDLRRMNRSGTERYEVIAAPAPPSVNIPMQTTPGCTPPPGCAQRFDNATNFGGHVQPGVQYSPRPTRMVADAIDAVRKAQVCEECGGSGWYQGFNSRQPCSRGCKP